MQSRIIVTGALTTRRRARWTPGLGGSVSVETIPWLQRLRPTEEIPGDEVTKSRWNPSFTTVAVVVENLPWRVRGKLLEDIPVEEARTKPLSPWISPQPVPPPPSSDISFLRKFSPDFEVPYTVEPKRQPTWIYSRQAPIQPIPPGPLPPVPPQPPLPVGLGLTDEDVLEAIQVLWQTATVTQSAEVVDDDTLQAIQGAWTAMALLPAFFSHLPQTGRLKSPQALPYAQVSCKFKRRELAGTAGAWHDYREVTICIRGTKAQCVQAAGNVLAVFNRLTTLQYPSTNPVTGLPRFIQWWPDDEVELEQDETTKDGFDIWMATLKATVWSTRLY